MYFMTGTLVMKSLEHQILYIVNLPLINTYFTTHSIRLQIATALLFIMTMKFQASMTQYQIQYAMNLVIQLTIHSIKLRRYKITPLIITMKL